MNKHIIINLLGVFTGVLLAIFDDKTGLGLAHNIIIPIIIVILFELFFLYEFITNEVLKTTDELNNMMLFNKINDEETKKRIIEISELIIKLEKKQELQAKKSIFNLFFKRINESLDECKESLTQMQTGKAPINKKNQNYWKDGVMKHVEKSIWTTNIPDHLNSFGRSNMPELIAVQKEAIKKGIIITRVFVINEPNILENMENLKSVMKEQVDIGIFVKVLEYSDLKDISRREKYGREIGFDFMILDDRLLYLTYVESDPMSEVNLTELVNDKKLLSDAKRFQETISKRAKSFEEWDKLLNKNE